MKETYRLDLFECIQTDLINLHHSVQQLAKQIEDNKDHWSVIRAMTKKSGMELHSTHLEWESGGPTGMVLKVNLTEVIRQSLGSISNAELLEEWLSVNSGGNPIFVEYTIG